MAIAGVGSFSRSLTDGLAREGRVILGGDLSFSLIHREADAEERAFLARHGDVSVAATMRAMTRTADGRSALVELKAVDAAYPLYGAVRLDPAQPLAGATARRDGAFGAVADPALLARLDLKPGARLTIGAATIEITAVLASEPDKLAGGIGFGPRVIISEDALRATGLLQPGSLVRWHYRLRVSGGSDRAADAAVTQANSQFPECRLGNPHPQQCFAGARAQRRALHAVPDAGRPDRVAGRRRRRRQRGQEPPRPPARRDRHAEGAGRYRRARVRDLSVAGAAAGHDRLGDRTCDRRRPAVRHRGGVRRDHPAADRARALSARTGAGVRIRPPDRARLCASGRSAAPTTCRFRRCSATRLRPSAAGRAGVM